MEIFSDGTCQKVCYSNINYSGMNIFPIEILLFSRCPMATPSLITAIAYLALLLVGSQLLPIYMYLDTHDSHPHSYSKYITSISGLLVEAYCDPACCSYLVQPFLNVNECAVLLHVYSNFFCLNKFVNQQPRRPTNGTAVGSQIVVRVS